MPRKVLSYQDVLGFFTQKESGRAKTYKEFLDRDIQSHFIKEGLRAKGGRRGKRKGKEVEAPNGQAGQPSVVAQDEKVERRQAKKGGRKKKGRAKRVPATQATPATPETTAPPVEE